MKLYDISPTVSSGTPVFPGDTPFTQKILMDYKNGDPFFLSSIHSTVHIGSHADSFLHFHKEGEPIDQLDLNYYIGKVQVIEVKLKKNERIYPEHVKNYNDFAPRVLFKTNSFNHDTQWSGDFNSLSSELISFLAEQKVILVGIDTPSVDPAEDKELPSHQMLYQKKIANLEGLLLSHVPEGYYELIALPLKLKGLEASPVRAVLREIEKI